MTQEEKAHRYDEAIKRGKQIKGTPYTAHWDIMVEVVEHLFPELIESDDEKIRKELIQYLKDYPNLPNGNYCRADFFAWIERQGDKDKLIQELSEYKVKYTQEVLESA